MTKPLHLDGKPYDLQENETVLDALLRQGVEVPNSCKAGACQCCIMRAVEGDIPPEAQVGLKPTLKEQGYFLSCSCRPTGPLKLESAGESLHFPTQITALEDLGAAVMRVHLAIPPNFSYRSGQFLTLISPDGVARSYSLASLPEEDTLELHIRKIPGGHMSTWIFEQAKVGDTVTIAGPAGDCFYTQDAAEQPLLLVGTGTGLAPLFGILKDALKRGHKGKISLFHGALEPNGLYHRELLANYAGEFHNFEYHPCVLRNGDDTVHTGEIDKIILQHYPSLQGWRGYICGNPDLVKMLRKKFFLSGMSMKDITADAFLPSQTKPTQPA